MTNGAIIVEIGPKVRVTTAQLKTFVAVLKSLTAEEKEGFSNLLKQTSTAKDASHFWDVIAGIIKPD